MSLRTAALTFTMVLAGAGFAMAQHGGDILVEDVQGKITTGLFNETTRIHDHHVFASEFGEFVPNFTDEPGFDSDAGEFQFGSTIGFNVLDALRIWDGQDFDAMAPVAVRISFASLMVETGSGFVPGFGLPVGSNGEWHRHLNFVINEPAPAGIYLLALELWSDDPALEASEPFFIVFNQETDELVHGAAIGWAERNLVSGIHFQGVDLAAGRNNVFAVVGATPGQRVTFIYGFQFGSTNIPGCPGVTVGIRQPTVFGAAPADGSGRAAITRFVPEAASGRIVLFGAVEQATCSVGNIVEQVFE